MRLNIYYKLGAYRNSLLVFVNDSLNLDSLNISE